MKGPGRGCSDGRKTKKKRMMVVSRLSELVQMAGCERKKDGEEDNDRLRWVAIGAEGDGVCFVR